MASRGLNFHSILRHQLPTTNNDRPRSENFNSWKDCINRVICQNKKSWIFSLLAGFIIVRMWIISIEKQNFRLMAFTIFLMFVAVYIYWRQRCRRYIRRSEDIATPPPGSPTPFPNGTILHFAQQVAQQSRGVPVSERSKFKYFDYHNSEEASDDLAWAQDGCCSICLCEYTEGDSLCQLMPCGHVFHKECIGAWIDTHTECPMCKTNLLRPFEGNAIEDEQITVVIEESSRH